jgi:hypothetical protein
VDLLQGEIKVAVAGGVLLAVVLSGFGGFSHKMIALKPYTAPPRCKGDFSVNSAPLIGGLCEAGIYRRQPPVKKVWPLAVFG